MKRFKRLSLCLHGLLLIALLLMAGCTPATTVTPTDQGAQVGPAPAPATEVEPGNNNPTAAQAPTDAPPTPTNAAEVAQRITILHTNDSRGYVDPCG